MAPRPLSLPHAAKRRKVSTNTSAQTEVASLESKISEAIAANASLNPLTDLLDLTQTSIEPNTVHKCIYALYRVFVSLISKGALEPQVDGEAKVVRQWILERLDETTAFLLGLLQDEESSLRTSALSILFSLLKHLSGSLSKPSHPQFHVSFFKKILHALLFGTPPTRGRKGKRTAEDEASLPLHADVRDLFIGTHLSVHDDIRWFFLRDSQPILANHAPEKYPHVRENMLSLLERLTTFPTEASELNAWWVEPLGVKPPKPKKTKNAGAASDEENDDDEDEEEDDWRKFFDEKDAKDTDKDKAKGPSVRLHQLTVHQSLHSLASHRAVFTRLWLTLLPQLSSGDGGSAFSMRALNIMHRGVMPHLTRAVMLNDWVGSCVDFGGAVGLLALNTLFILMSEYNLDYPSFYTRLYAFLDKDVLHLKHRARFFRLTDLFLSSSHLPATLLASFIKRLARLSLTAPPASIVILIPFTYNILKRHPALMVMIHRDALVPGFEDPFLPAEPNPNLTHALDSSLWELYTHRQHYHAGVSTLARIFEEAFTKPAYPLEDFLDHTYATLFDAEAGRRIKKEPAVAFELPKHLFPTADAEDVHAENDVLGELWSFA